MPIWKHNGNRFVQYPFWNKNLGLAVFICCPGPSLAQVNSQDFKVPGIFTIGVNTAYPQIRPDLWVGLDSPGCYNLNLYKESFPKIWNGNQKDQVVNGIPLHCLPNNYFADLETKLDPAVILESKGSESVVFVWNQNTFTFALDVAVHIGADKIYLVGCDFGGASDYYDQRKLSKQLHDMNRRLYAQQVEMLRVLAPKFKAAGIMLRSCTLNSPINSFVTYVPLHDAIVCEDRTQRPTPLLHATEALEALAWKGSATAPVSCGFMTGCDRAQEWMLDWWGKHFRKHNPDALLTIADFGMSAEGLAKAKLLGNRILKVEGTSRYSWFKKPFAIKASPYDVTVWLDLDCEVRAPLGYLFDCIRPGQVSVVADPWDDESGKPECYNTGVIGVVRNNALIEAWCQSINNNVVQYRGDQGYFNNCVLNRSQIHERSRQDNFFYPAHVAAREALVEQDCLDDIKVRHYVGPEGKATIAGIINREIVPG